MRRPARLHIVANTNSISQSSRQGSDFPTLDLALGATRRRPIGVPKEEEATPSSVSTTSELPSLSPQSVISAEDQGFHQQMLSGLADSVGMADPVAVSLTSCPVGWQTPVPCDAHNLLRPLTRSQWRAAIEHGVWAAETRLSSKDKN